MKKVFCLFLTVFACAVFANQASAVKTVAVYVEGYATPSQKSIVNSSVLEKVTDSYGYLAYERNDAFLSAIQKEQDFQLSGEVLPSQIRALGSKMGVDYLIVMNVVIAEDGYCQMAGKLINMVTGRVLKTRTNNRTYEGTRTLVAMSNYITHRLLNE